MATARVSNMEICNDNGKEQETRLSLKRPFSETTTTGNVVSPQQSPQPLLTPPDPPFPSRRHASAGTGDFESFLSLWSEQWDTIVDAMRQHPDNNAIQSLGHKVMRQHMMRFDKEKRLATLTDLEVVLATMKGNMLDARIQRSGCQALSLIAVRQEALAIRKGGIDLILDAMLHFGTETVLEEAFQALGVLFGSKHGDDINPNATKDDCKNFDQSGCSGKAVNALDLKGGMGLVLGVMRAHPSNENLQCNGLLVCKQFLLAGKPRDNGDDDNDDEETKGGNQRRRRRDVFVAMHGMDHILSTMRHHVDNAKIGCSCCSIVLQHLRQEFSQVRKSKDDGEGAENNSHKIVDFRRGNELLSVLLFTMSRNPKLNIKFGKEICTVLRQLLRFFAPAPITSGAAASPHMTATPTINESSPTTVQLLLSMDAVSVVVAAMEQDSCCDCDVQERGFQFLLLWAIHNDDEDKRKALVTRGGLKVVAAALEMATVFPYSDNNAFAEDCCTYLHLLAPCVEQTAKIGALSSATNPETSEVISVVGAVLTAVGLHRSSHVIRQFSSDTLSILSNKSNGNGNSQNKTSKIDDVVRGPIWKVIWVVMRDHKGDQWIQEGGVLTLLRAVAFHGKATEGDSFFGTGDLLMDRVLDAMRNFPSNTLLQSDGCRVLRLWVASSGNATQRKGRCNAIVEKGGMNVIAASMESYGVVKTLESMGEEGCSCLNLLVENCSAVALCDGQEIVRSLFTVMMREDLLKKHNIGIQRRACQVLWKLYHCQPNVQHRPSLVRAAQCSIAATCFSHHHVSPVVVLAMLGFAKVCNVIQKGFDIIVRFLDLKEYTDTFSEAVDAIFTILMPRSPSDDGVQHLGCKILRLWASESDHNRAALISSGAMTVVAAAIMNVKVGTRTREEGCRCLNTLVRCTGTAAVVAQSRQQASDVYDEQRFVVAALLTAMRAKLYSMDLFTDEIRDLVMDLERHACTALWSLLQHKVNSKKAASSLVLKVAKRIADLESSSKENSTINGVNCIPFLLRDVIQMVLLAMECYEDCVCIHSQGFKIVRRLQFRLSKRVSDVLWAISECPFSSLPSAADTKNSTATAGAATAVTEANQCTGRTSEKETKN